MSGLEFSKGSTASLVLLIAVYLTLNTSLNLMNKVGISSMNYPVLYETMVTIGDLTR